MSLLKWKVYQFMYILRAMQVKSCLLVKFSSVTSVKEEDQGLDW